MRGDVKLTINNVRQVSEREATADHGIEHHTHTPNIYFRPDIFLCKDLENNKDEYLYPTDI